MDIKGLNAVLREANALTSKPTISKTEERRLAYLQTAAAAIRSGASLHEVTIELHNDEELRNGIKPTQFTKSSLTVEQRSKAQGWRALAEIGTKLEHRDMLEGNTLVAQLGTYSDLGYFVPTDFFPQVFATLKQHDCLFDGDTVTLIRSNNGRPLPVPTGGDTENIATIVGESAADTETDIASTGHVSLGAYNYRSRRLNVSMEAFQDLESGLSTVDIFTRFAADALARGIGKHLVNGTGTNQPLGLLPSLVNVGAPVVVATGSAANDGSGNTGANSLGTADFASAFDTLDAAYLASPKIKWVMNLKTFGNILNLSDKYGRPVDLIKYQDGTPTIYGIPVGIAPSMASIGASNVPVVLGDFSYWATRLIVDGLAGVKVFKEAPGLIENGEIGLRSYCRADGALLFTDTNSDQCPFVTIQNHS